MIIDKINKYLSESNSTVNEHLRYEVERLAGFAFRRQFMDTYENKPGVLRLSSAGKCPRSLAYKFHDYEKKGKEMDSRSKIIFFQGDLVELMMMNLAKLAGVGVVGTGLNQIAVFLPIVMSADKTVLVEGHPDGYIIDAGARLLECKSMASYAYERFENGEVDPGYRAQINTYLEGSGLEECVLVAMNKDNGVLGETIIKKDPAIITAVKAEFKSVLLSTKEELPEPPKDLACDEKGIYPWNCLYCAYWGWCRTNAEKVLVGRSYKLKEKGVEKPAVAKKVVKKDPEPRM